MAVIDDVNLQPMDLVSFSSDMQERMVLLEYFNAVSTTICFILGAFQLLMTLQSNIKDSMWELGVLRSIGCTRTQITRVMVYELIANTLSAMTLGYSTGIMVSMLTIA